MDGLLTLLPLIYLLARGLIGFYFIFLGLWTIYHWTPILQTFIKDKIPCPWLVLQVGILYQVLVGGMIFFGVYVQLAALLLMPFMVISVFIFHPFWRHRGELLRLHFSLFIAHVTLSLGALLLLLSSSVHGVSLI